MIKTLLMHAGHNVAIVEYGERIDDETSIIDPVNVSLECEDCNEVIISRDI
jgi:hypothetical protein